MEKQNTNPNQQSTNDNLEKPGELEIPPKYDDSELPGYEEVPTEQEPGMPDVPGEGPAGQTPNEYGYLPQEGEGFVYHVDKNGVRAKVGIDPRDRAPAEHIYYTDEHGNRKRVGGDHHGQGG